MGKNDRRIGERILTGFKDGSNKDEGMRKTRRKYRKSVGNKTLNEREDDGERTKKVKKVLDKE
jgi:hypothetical protein